MLKHRIPCLALAGLLNGLAASAAPDVGTFSPEALMRLPPSEQRAYLAAHSARLDARRAAASPAAGPLDVTPPVLTQFDASATLNLQLAQPNFRVLTRITDDLSGFEFMYYQAWGPSGQSRSGAVQAFYPVKNFVGKASAPYFNDTRMLEPGLWTITYAYVVDFAGNYVNYNQAQLAALGNTTFTVLNTRGHDLVAPILTSGQILTPSVSLSSSAPGTSSTPPYIGVKLGATDAGTTAVAGLYFAQASFCLADRSRCIYAQVNTAAQGQTAATLYLGGQVSASSGHVPGEYLLYQIAHWDNSGNGAWLTSTAFGGSTDFSTLFPATAITLTP